MMEMPKAPAAPMPAPDDEGQAPAAPKAGGAKQLVTDIHDKLMDLADLIGQAPGMEEDAAKVADLVTQFQAVVDGLGQAPGAKKPAAPSAPGSVPMESGVADVKPAL